MNRKRVSSVLITSFISGVMGVIYGLSLKNGMDVTPVATAVIYFVLGAVLGVGCGVVALLVSGLFARLPGKRPLSVTLIVGVVLGVAAGVVTGQDVVLCAMLGEVGALVLGHEGSEVVIGN